MVTSLLGARHSRGALLMLFRTARILRAHDHEARWKRAVYMSGTGVPRSQP
jgi:hypothetical protein